MQGAAAELLTPIRSIVLETDSVMDAELRLIALGVSDLYVITPDGRLTGILPDYEVLKRRLAGDLRSLRVADLMSPAEVQVSSSTTIAELAERMRLSCYRRLPVVDNGRLVGEVTRRSLLRHLQAVDRGREKRIQTSVMSAPVHAAFGPPKFLRTSRLEWMRTDQAARVAIEG